MSHFAELLANVAKMGAPIEPPAIDVTLAPSAMPTFAEGLDSGIEIALDDLSNAAEFGGLLGYKGAQVLLYIREQGQRIDRIHRYPSSGPRYHVASCQTLQRMRTQNRFGRYVVTNDMSGTFRLVDDENGPPRELRAELLVCRDCLKFLNYQDFRKGERHAQSVFDNFSLPTFFSTYSTLFEFMPTGAKMAKSGDARSWKRQPGTAPGSIKECHSCGLRLPADSFLLGVPSGPEETGQHVICADCRRKPPLSEPVHVSERDMKTITAARRKVAAGAMGGRAEWKASYAFADPAFHGLMKVHQRQGYDPPEIGVELKDEHGAVCANLELAWPASRYAVVLHEHEAELARAQKWNAFVLQAASINAREDG